jgi:hypothetical protein
MRWSRTLTKLKEFKVLFRALIDRHTPALTARLRTLVQTPPPPAMEVLLFVIFSDWDEYPIQASAYNRQATEVYFKAPFYGQMLPRRKLILKDAIDQEAVENEGIATFETGAVVTAEWFGKCWHQAGGNCFSVPAFIQHHDHCEAYDLRRRRWVKDTDIWE